MSEKRRATVTVEDYVHAFAIISTTVKEGTTQPAMCDMAEGLLDRALLYIEPVEYKHDECPTGLMIEKGD